MFTDIVAKQQNFFYEGSTKSLSFRVKQLQKLKSIVKSSEKDILKALKQDLNRPPLESYASEVGFILSEISYTLKNIHNWMSPKKVKLPITYFGTKAFIVPEPLGLALIFGTWNYPFLLSLLPLAGAISSGNCAIVKPSEYAATSSNIIKKIINDNFDPAFITVAEGGVTESEALLAQKFDFIFFTGNPNIGKIVMSEAAKTLTPVALELGGKSPCIVHKDANIKLAAEKIAWAKFINAGQTCVAPDYLLVHNQIKEELIRHIKEYITKFYGKNPAESPDYCRIINEKHFDRLSAFLRSGNIIIGGQTNRDNLYIAPTVIDNVFSLESAIMEEEIFGPIIPIIPYEDIRRAVSIIRSKPKPLAAYIFCDDSNTENYILNRVSCGSVCINDIMLQTSTYALPFGGVGESGMGRYHGKASFDTFSNFKSILQAPKSFDIKLRYPPYKTSSLKIMKLFLR
ncbi:MAG: aldehyde dehydrogenase [Candidatus Omnitrophica bacterium]|nr:aldehyde dehydrogenase [Candidatus Omnitrophota bacterium]